MRTWPRGCTTMRYFAALQPGGTPERVRFQTKNFGTSKQNLETFKSARFSDEDVRLAPLSQIVVELFDWIGGPIEVDLLVRIVGYLLKIKDDRIESLSEQATARWGAHLSVITQSGESYVETKELLAWLWGAVIKLSAEQRDAFAFRFEDPAGQGFFEVLVAAGIV